MNAPFKAHIAKPSCGNCGATFVTKGEKRRHKQTGCQTQFDPGDNAPCQDQDLYGRYKPTPEVIAAANAEWAAMDWRGRLPKGWVNPVTGKPGDILKQSEIG